MLTNCKLLYCRISKELLLSCSCRHTHAFLLNLGDQLMSILNFKCSKKWKQKSSAITSCFADNLWVLCHWNVENTEGMSTLHRALLTSSQCWVARLSYPAPCCNTLLFYFFFPVEFNAFSSCNFSLKSWRCYLSLSQQYYFFAHLTWLCPVKFLKVLSAIYQCPLKCEPQLPSSALSPAVELRLGEATGNSDPCGSEAAEVARNWTYNHHSDIRTRENKWKTLLGNGK